MASASLARLPLTEECRNSSGLAFGWWLALKCSLKRFGESAQLTISVGNPAFSASLPSRHECTIDASAESDVMIVSSPWRIGIWLIYARSLLTVMFFFFVVFIGCVFD